MHALLLVTFITSCIHAQVAVGKVYSAKEFSKEIALYRAKEFLIEEVLGKSPGVIKYSIDPLAATKSGELTSLVYQCDEKKQEGLILGFFGDRWNEAGVVYQSFAFKHLPKVSAIEILTKLGDIIKENSKYLDADDDNNNIYFHYEDITFLIYRDGSVKIRAFWMDYDAEWEMIAYKRTRRRLLKKLE